MTESTQSLPQLPTELIERIIDALFTIEWSLGDANIDENYNFPKTLQINRFYRQLFSGWYYPWMHFYLRGASLVDLETRCQRFLTAMPEMFRKTLPQLEIQHV